MNLRAFPWLVAVALLICSPSVVADDKPVDYTAYKVNHVKWGDPVEGLDRPAFDSKALLGKIVIVEEFGVTLSDCIGRLSKLNSLAKKLERDKVPFAIVLIHRQWQVPDKDIVKEVKRLHKSIIVRKNGFSPVYWKGMPNTALFSHTGAMVWKGDPRKSEYRRELKKLIKAVEKK